ncbi:MAG: fibronectin type III domain-containing protein [Patescibacteria group bacterium]
MKKLLEKIKSPLGKKISLVVLAFIIVSSMAVIAATTNSGFGSLFGNVMGANQMDFNERYGYGYGYGHATPPDVPSNIHTGFVGPHAARIIWDAPQQQVTQYVVQYKKRPMGMVKMKFVPGNQTEKVLTNLQPDRKYWVRILAENQYGESDWSNKLRFRTRP